MIIVHDRWASWKLASGWTSGNCDIGWAETIALEIAIPWLVAENYNNTIVVIHSDNTGVIGTYNNSCSRNPENNLSLQCTTTALAHQGLTISPVYVSSALNLADNPSRGVLGHPSLHLSSRFTLPPCLACWLIPITP